MTKYTSYYLIIFIHFQCDNNSDVNNSVMGTNYKICNLYLLSAWCAIKIYSKHQYSFLSISPTILVTEMKKTKMKADNYETSIVYKHYTRSKEIV